MSKSRPACSPLLEIERGRRMEDDAQFKDAILYFWTERGDPTRYSYWDAERCAKLLPDFFYAWTLAVRYERLATDAIKRECAD